MEINKLIRQGESETVEFKQNFDKAAIIAIGAMANQRGGTIFIGVNDNGEIKGVQVGKETLQQWSNQIAQTIEPKVVVNISAKKIKEKSIVVIEVVEHPIKPVAVNGKYYRRIANSNRQLTISEIAESHLISINKSWDSFPAEDCELSDIDFDKVQEYIYQAKETGRKKISSSAQPIEVLEKLDLTKQNKPTWAALLLFGKHPADFINQARVHCGRFKGTSTIIDDNYIDGDIIHQVEEAMVVIKKGISVKYIITGNPKRKEVWDYPLEAIREAVLNAVCHRDYRDNAEIIIKIYDDEISIWNPGRLPQGITIEELRKYSHQSKPRNHKIAEIFYDIGEIEKFGSGIQRISDACKSAGIPEPVFEETSGGFHVLFRKTRIKEKINSVDFAERFALNQRQKKIIDYLNSNENISLSDCKKLIPDISEKTLYRDLSDLVRLNIIRELGEKRGRRYILAEGYRT